MEKKIELREIKTTVQPKWFDILRNDKEVGYVFLRAGTTIWEVTHYGCVTEKFGNFDAAVAQIAYKEKVSVQDILITEN